MKVQLDIIHIQFVIITKKVKQDYDNLRIKIFSLFVINKLIVSQPNECSFLDNI